MDFANILKLNRKIGTPLKNRRSFMRRILLLTVIIFTIAIFGSNANAYLLNDYFGVTLQVGDWGSYHNQFINSWTPTQGYVWHDNWRPDGHSPAPGPTYVQSELFDLEAVYTDYDQGAGDIVFSILTSMPDVGTKVSWWGNWVFRPGDLIFNCGEDQYVMETAFTTYGLNVTPNAAKQGFFYKNPNMNYFDGQGGNQRGYPQGNPSYGGNLYGEIDWTGGDPGAEASWDLSSDFVYDNIGYWENGYDSYLIEGRIPWSLFNPTHPCPNGCEWLWSTSCNNDWGDGPVVPEPSTLVLLGLGLIGLGAYRRRKK
jgi:hypothetical protein